jgi:sucrose-6F-phosphate phosphohydrolase
MPMTKLLLCTDLDRTLLPNGGPPEHPAARPLFSKLCARPEVTLAYVSGRHLQLVEEAITAYAVPRPDYIISDVGTKIYQCSDQGWQELSAWQQRIALDWRGKSPQQLHQILKENSGLSLQEATKQNDFKLSYYASPTAESEPLLCWAQQQLEQNDVAANLIWSIDEQAHRGLLDVLPRSANKLQAIEFLQRHLAERAQQTIFAGDSGNDLQVLASAIPAVLVANASAELKQQARQLAVANGHSDALFLASAEESPLGGNYSAGILQGVAHFAPQYAAWLKQEGVLP